MSKQIVTLISDDLDGSAEAKTRQFGLNGDQYEIDLSDANYAELEQFLSRYVAVASKKSSAPRASQKQASPARANREEMQNIRSWAKANGIPVNERGRIALSVQDAYRAAHS